jgi:uncharacterized membrane protein YkoI
MQKAPSANKMTNVSVWSRSLIICIASATIVFGGGCVANVREDHQHHHSDGHKNGGHAKGHDHDDDKDDDKDDDDVDMDSKKITQAELPNATWAAFQKEFPGAKVIEIEQSTHGGDTHYEFEFIDAQGKESDVEYDAAGKRVED